MADKILRKTLIFFMFFILTISCNNKSDYDLQFVKKLAQMDDKNPSRYFNYNLFFILDNSQIIQTNINTVYKIYFDNYKKDEDFETFLMKIFSKEQTLKISEIEKYNKQDYFYKIYSIDDKIYNDEIKNIINQYLKMSDTGYHLYPNNLNKNEIATILYRMFDNNYKIQQNDYSGYYSLKK